MNDEQNQRKGRSSLRLKGYNYSRDGFYFITICTHSRWMFFGKILDGKMHLSQMGLLARKIWKMIENQCDRTRVDEWVIMPDHIHGIIEIGDGQKGFLKNIPGQFCRSAINRASTKLEGLHVGGVTGIRNPMLHPGSVSNMVRWFKGRTTHDIREKFPLEDFSWQPKFHDRIIRSQQELHNVRQYIENNPKNWREI